MNCENCEYKKLCHALVLEGLIDLSCEDVANIANADKEDSK